jgi:dihydrofolate reductase
MAFSVRFKNVSAMETKEGCMGKTVLYMGISFDGYIAGPHDETDWMDPYADVEYGFNDFLDTVGALIMGHRSYDVGVEKGWFSQFDYRSPIFVVSREMPATVSSDADFTFVTEGIEAAHSRAKDMAGDRDVYLYGGADLAAQYLKAGLIDEMTLGVVPIILGDGRRLFEGVKKRTELKLLDVRRFDKDLVMLRYAISAA